MQRTLIKHRVLFKDEGGREIEEGREGEREGSGEEEGEHTSGMGEYWGYQVGSGEGCENQCSQYTVHTCRELSKNKFSSSGRENKSGGEKQNQ